MARIRVSSFAVSLDGFGAGPNQGLDNPLGVNGPDLMEWFFHTRTWRSMHGEAGGDTGVDDEIAAQGMSGFGAWILGRNMFGPVRGPWPDESWKGWWGEDPPYHVPTFVLTHHVRPPLAMRGGTTFYFVTGGIQEAVRLAREAAGDQDIRVGGGVATVRQFLAERLIDEVHLALRPVLLGAGEELFHGLDLRALGYQVSRRVEGERATHLFLTRS